MKKLNTLLAAINMSDLDDEVIKRALLIAKENDAQLNFVYAIDIPVMDIEISSESFKKSIYKESIKQELVQKINAVNESKNLEYFIHITIGDAFPDIIHVAHKTHSELIVLSSNSKIRVEDYYLGDTINHLADDSALPVLVIKKSVKESYKNILAPTDLTSASKQSILFAKMSFHSSTIKLVHAYEKLDDLDIDYVKLNAEDDEQVYLGRPQVNVFKEEVKINDMTMLQTSLPINLTLLNYINEQKSDLIVLGSSGSDIAGSYLGSTSAFLLRNTESDILIVQVKDNGF